jgi:hypothetical protein
MNNLFLAATIFSLCSSAFGDVFLQQGESQFISSGTTVHCAIPQPEPLITCSCVVGGGTTGCRGSEVNGWTYIKIEAVSLHNGQVVWTKNENVTHGNGQACIEDCRAQIATMPICNRH